MTAIIACTVLLAGIPGSNIVDFDSYDADGCSFTVDVGRPDFQEYMGYWYPVIQGMPSSFLSGQYMLPSLTVYVPVPPGTMPRMFYSESGHQRAEAPGPLLVTPVGTGSGLDVSWSPGTPGTDAMPSEAVSVDTMRLAGTLVAAVTVSPYHGNGNVATVPSSISVELDWPSTPGARRLDNPLLEAVCPSDAVYWPLGGGTDQASPFWGRPWARISIMSTGIYVVTGEELEQNGIEITGTPSASLRMFTGPGTMFDLFDPSDQHDLQEMPIEVMDGGDGIFDSGDTLKFFGQTLDRFGFRNNLNRDRLYHRYADHNVYWLTWGGESGSRVDTLNALPDGSPSFGDSLPFSIWQEQDYLWVGGREPRTGWVWTQLLNNMPSYFYFSTPSADGDASIDLSLVPGSPSSDSLDLLIELNSATVMDTTLRISSTTEIKLEGMDLSESMNLLKVTVSGGSSNIYLDHLLVEYPRKLSYAGNRLLAFDKVPDGRYTFSLGGARSETDLLDISDPLHPARIRGSLSGSSLRTSLTVKRQFQYWLEDPQGYLSPDSILPAQPGRIIGTGLEGDVAIVVGDQLWDAAQPLQTIYSARGRTAVLVKASEVYDEFGQGVRDPGAIRSFFRYTQDNWSKPAQALLLVGDGNFDPMMHITARPTLIPICLELVTYEEDGLNVEDAFVIAHSGTGTQMPEAPVSRISASSPEELTAYLSKVMTYDEGSSPGEWENRIVLTADDEWGSGQSEILHTQTCDSIADRVIPPSFQRKKFYLIEYPWPPGTTASSPHPEKPQAREDFIQLMSQGCSSMIFVGHGSYGQLAHEKLLVSSDVQLIDNQQRQPVMIFASCNVGQFDLISANCLAEDFELMPGAGSILSIGSTGKSYNGQNQVLFMDYYGSQYGGSPEIDVSTALWAAKIQSGTVRYSNNKKYVILGDGGVVPVRPSTDECSFQVQSDTLFRGRLNGIAGSFGYSSNGILDVTESGAYRTYYGISGVEINYLKYGSSIFHGMVTCQGSDFSTSVFMPVQADTGSFCRGQALGISAAGTECAWDEWMSAVDDGSHASDSIPPQIDMWIQGHQGEPEPTVSGDAVLRAVLSDSSGICAMSGGAGRSILLSLDDQGFDISAYFSYRTDSHTVGELEYTIPDMLEGEHRLIMAAWDGMGNPGRDTLDFQVVQAPDYLLSSVFVYPNPGGGQRCFNFMTSQPGTAEISIYTVAGRCIWRTAESCGEGYNQVLWDGLDMDHDSPAMGAYIYRVEYRAQDGSSAVVTDIMAVTED